MTAKALDSHQNQLIRFGLIALHQLRAATDDKEILDMAQRAITSFEAIRGKDFCREDVEEVNDQERRIAEKEGRKPRLVSCPLWSGEVVV